MGTYSAFDPMDPLDNMIMTSPEYDKDVDKIEEEVQNIADGKDGIYESAYEAGIAADQFRSELDADVGFADDGDMLDNAADPVDDDAAEYGSAEMELLGGEFGNNAVDAVDGFEFTGLG